MWLTGRYNPRTNELLVCPPSLLAPLAAPPPQPPGRFFGVGVLSMVVVATVADDLTVAV